MLGSEWNENHATKNQVNFQGPILAPSAEGINHKCRLGQENRKSRWNSMYGTYSCYLVIWSSLRTTELSGLREIPSTRVQFLQQHNIQLYASYNWIRYIYHSLVIALDSEVNMTIKFLYLKWECGHPKYRIKLTPQTPHLTVCVTLIKGN